jgi:serine phosphatase RsbU (regulator of sigma subunit)
VAESPLVVAVAARPYPGETLSGDAWQVDWDGERCRVAVIDGLGHGAKAADAADSARTVLAAQPGLSPTAALEACHRGLTHTRGAAMWVGTIDLAAGRLTYAGVGNVSGRLWHQFAGQRGEQRLIGQRGIIGATVPTLRAYECALERGWFLLIHTDGVSERFAVERPDGALLAEPQALVEGLLLGWGREGDDALVVGICAQQ